MAGTGLGIFLPSETAYKDPNRFRDVLMAEGNKEAQYLAQMDQFFAQLDETKRQFDITATQKESMFEQELAFNKDKLSWQSAENALNRDLEYDKMNVTSDFESKKLEFSYKQLDAQTRGQDIAAKQAQDELAMVKEKNDFFRSIYETRETQRADTHDVARQLLTGEGGIAGTSGGTGFMPFESSSSSGSPFANTALKTTVTDDWGNEYDKWFE